MLTWNMITTQNLLQLNFSFSLSKPESRGEDWELLVTKQESCKLCRLSGFWPELLAHTLRCIMLTIIITSFFWREGVHSYIHMASGFFPASEDVKCGSSEHILTNCWATSSVKECQGMIKRLFELLLTLRSYNHETKNVFDKKA